MAYDLRSYDAGRASRRMQPPPARQVSGFRAPAAAESGMKGSDAYVPSGLPQASPAGAEQTPVEGGSAAGTAPGIPQAAGTGTENPDNPPMAASEAGAWEPLLDLEPENILKGILFSEIFGKPKSMRRGRR